MKATWLCKCAGTPAAHDVAGGSLYSACVSYGGGAECPSGGKLMLHVCVQQRNFCPFVQNGSQKRARDSGELTNVADTDTPWKKPDAPSCMGF